MKWWCLYTIDVVTPQLLLDLETLSPAPTLDLLWFWIENLPASFSSLSWPGWSLETCRDLPFSHACAIRYWGTSPTLTHHPPPTWSGTEWALVHFLPTQPSNTPGESLCRFTAGNGEEYLLILSLQDTAQHARLCIHIQHYPHPNVKQQVMCAKHPELYQWSDTYV